MDISICGPELIPPPAQLAVHRLFSISFIPLSTKGLGTSFICSWGGKKLNALNLLLLTGAPANWKSRLIDGNVFGKALHSHGVELTCARSFLNNEKPEEKKQQQKKKPTTNRCLTPADHSDAADFMTPVQFVLVFSQSAGDPSSRSQFCDSI